MGQVPPATVQQACSESRPGAPRWEFQRPTPGLPTGPAVGMSLHCSISTAARRWREHTWLRRLPEAGLASTAKQQQQLPIPRPSQPRTINLNRRSAPQPTATTRGFRHVRPVHCGPGHEAAREETTDAPKCVRKPLKPRRSHPVSHRSTSNGLEPPVARRSPRAPVPRAVSVEGGTSAAPASPAAS